VRLPIWSGRRRPASLALWQVQGALARPHRLLPGPPAGTPMERILPEPAGEAPEVALLRRAALASTLLAGLETSRGGTGEPTQARAFSTVRVTPEKPATA
jgi:segregation and condensation protein A